MLADEIPHARQGRHPLGDVRRAGTQPCGRPRTVPPEVDGRVEHVHGGGQHLCLHGDQRVLAVPEFEPMRVPERAPVDLVPDHPVLQQGRVTGHVRRLHRLRVGVPMERRLPHLFPIKADDVSACEVGSGRVQRPGQQLAGIRRQRVLTVGEREVAAFRLLDTGVDGGRAGTGLDERETVVARGEVLGEDRSAVARPVVHHEHLDVAQRSARRATPGTPPAGHRWCGRGRRCLPAGTRAAPWWGCQGSVSGHRGGWRTRSSTRAAAWPSSCGQYRAANAARASRYPASRAAGSPSASTTSCAVRSSGPGASASKSK